MRARTLPELVQRAVHKHGPRTAIVYERDGEPHPVTYAQLGRLVEETAAGLVAQDLAPGEAVVLACPEGPQRLVADLAVQHAGGVTVPSEPSSAVDDLVDRLGGLPLGVLVVAGAERARRIADEMDTRAAIVATQRSPGAPELDAAGEPEEAGWCSIRQLTRQGKRALGEDREIVAQRWRKLGPEDPSTLGLAEAPARPAPISHGAMADNAQALASRVGLRAGDRVLCAGSPPRGLERGLARYATLHAGAQRRLAGAADEAPRTCRDAEPDVLVAGPRTLQALEREIEQRLAASQPLQRSLFAWARELGAERYRAKRDEQSPGIGLRLRHALADSLVLATVRHALGLEATRAIVTGEDASPGRRAWLASIGIPSVLGLAGPGAGVVAIESPDPSEARGLEPLGGLDVEVEAEGTGEILVRSHPRTEGPGTRGREGMADGWYPIGSQGRLEHGRLVIEDEAGSADGRGV